MFKKQRLVPKQKVGRNVKNLPTAVVTVRFAEPITGAQLAALVQKVAGEAFKVDKRYYDGDIFNFGQRTGYPYDHIRVVPALDGLGYFSAEGTYSEALVISSSWGGNVYAVGYPTSSVVNAVKKFAEAINDAYGAALTEGFPEYTDPKSSDWAD